LAVRSPPALGFAESPFLCLQDTLRQECDREATPKEYRPYTTKGLPEEQPLLCLYKETEEGLLYSCLLPINCTVVLS